MSGKEDGYVYRAKRTANFPIDSGALGHYAVAPVTGAVAAGLVANGEILQFRWTSSAAKAVIYSVRCTGLYATTAFAVGPLSLFMTIARSWTSDGSGGTTVSVFSDRQKLDTSYGSSITSVIRISTTAGLTAGTKTHDTTPIGQIVSHSSGGVGSATPIIGSVYLPSDRLFRAEIGNGQAPLVLKASEGFTIRATVPATGVWTAGFEIKWAEVPGDYRIS